MKKITRVILLIIITSLPLIGCVHAQDSNPANNTISVISLWEVLPLLEEEAQSWQNDACLRWANIRIGLGYPNDFRMLTASFDSPSAELESLLVYYTMDGSITDEIAKHHSPIPQQRPIKQEDWKIDSREALGLLLQEEELDFLQNEGDMECSFLTLERHGHNGEEHVVWSLTLTECMGDSLGHKFLDPITGEVLKEN